MCQGQAYARRGTGNGIRHVAEGLINTPLAAQWSVFECGLGADSAPIRRQSALLQPDVAVVTSIFPAHFAGYNSMQELVRYKLDIAAHLKPDGVLLLNADSPYHALCCDIATELRVGRILRFGRSTASDLHIESCSLGLDGTRLSLRWQGVGYHAHVPMIGDHWAGMVAAVAGGLGALQVDVQRGLDALAQVNVPPGRGDIVRHRVAGGEIIASDSHYNANPGSMVADLVAFGQLCTLHPTLRPIAVIGEYKELGALTSPAHRELGELLTQMSFQRIQLVGDGHSDTLAGLASHVAGRYLPAPKMPWRHLGKFAALATCCLSKARMPTIWCKSRRRCQPSAVEVVGIHAWTLVSSKRHIRLNRNQQVVHHYPG